MSAKVTITEEERVKRERALDEVIDGDRSIMSVAREWGLSRQAIQKWLYRYRERGTLAPKKNRRNLKALAPRERAEFYNAIRKIYEERGYKENVRIPNADRLKDTYLKAYLTRMFDRKFAIRYVRKLSIDLHIPIYYEPIPGLDEDQDLPSDITCLSRPEFNPEARPKPEPIPLPPRKEVVPEDEKIPEKMEDFDEWISETQGLMKKPKRKPQSYATAGRRTGKHARGKTQKKKRRKKPKRCR